MIRDKIRSTARESRHWLIAPAIGALLCAMAGTAMAQSAGKGQVSDLPDIVRRDLTNRAIDIHWREGFSPADADMFSHNELRIAASCERVWKHLIAAKQWPDFYPNGRDVQFRQGAGADGELKLGTVFRWQTFGQAWDTRVNEFVPFSRLGWFGFAPGSQQPVAYHAWLLKPEGDACLVATDEVGKGEGAIKVRQTDPGLVHRGHDLWLAGLRFVAEKPGS